MPSLAKRYRDGEHAEVWNALGTRFRSDPDSLYTEEFEEVMHETFSRVRSNVRRIIERLRHFGYEFESEAPQYGRSRAPLTPAGAATRDAVAWITDRFAVCPPSLTWFCSEVGLVDLRQSHRQLSDPQHSTDPVLMHLGDWDPLVFDGLEYFAYEVSEEGKGDNPHEMRDGRAGVELQFAPDRYHKANISGGDDYIICLPCSDLDPTIHDAQVSFMTYLRRCLGRGGFWGSPELLLNCGNGWLGMIEVEPGLFLPAHPIFETLASDLQEF